jgi:hypothetical protein
MPNSIVTELIRKVAKLEARIEVLFAYQKWQMTLLGLILATIIAEKFLGR